MAEPVKIEALGQAARTAALACLPDWSYDSERRALFRSLRLADFSQAMGLMIHIAIEAEKADHHPEWSNVYNRLDIWLTTHDADGVSERDIRIAQLIDGIVARRSC
ncbi:putative pterin-4-alpha-carbinolamine dehydratase [uncultured Sphingopyxis sp.]|uniref:Putative pterin-4-alpha-carbinolamine dehydratase n=1 Tax=uncultured Sphingopyxis sp. TaxID=310581 RepID=A0A1Y5PP43_9SPHN|nr:4a-hydroxytetrahydrobiopterin dehydratase [uncultured Sphingopyxis sp.]SBV31832.1 putative pterin-4-alpha-carbinolamine dehydratase [uncultured Sphingopyxis sp.]